MENVQFRIVSVTSEKRMDGITTVVAEEVESGLQVSIAVGNQYSSDRDFIREKLLNKYEILNRSLNRKIPVQSGDIL